MELDLGLEIGDKKEFLNLFLLMNVTLYVKL